MPGFPAVGVDFYGLATTLPMDYGSPDSSLQVCVVLLVLMVPGFALLKANDFREQTKARLQAIKEGRVLIFEGRAAGISDDKIKNFVPSSTRCRIEALRNGHILTINGQEPLVALQAALVEGGNVGKKSWPVALRPLRDSQRQLSFEETEEILRYSWRQTWKVGLPGVGLTLFLGASLGAILWAGSKPRWEFGATHLVILWIIVVYAGVSNALLMRKMRFDALGGLLLQTVDADNNVTEILPRSKQVWTFNGQATAWRETQKSL